MNLPVMAAALLVLVLAAIGWPGARSAGRTPAWSVATVPAVAGLVAAFGVMLSVATSTSLLVWLVLAALVGVAVLVARRGAAAPAWASDDQPGRGVLVVALAVSLLPVVLVDLPPVESDARFIWWFHAAWFRGGGAVAREALSHPAFGPTHPGYPPAAPALIAAVWHLADAYDRELALRVSQLLTAGTVAAGGFFVASALRLVGRQAMVVAAVVVAVTWGTNPSVGLSGFVDLLWAAALLSGAVLLLVGPVDRRSLTVGALFVAMAALTKYEAGAAVSLLVLLVFVRAGSAWRRVVPVAVGVGAALVSWVAVTVLADADTSDRGDWSTVFQVLDRGSVVHGRAVETIGHLSDELGPLVWLGAVAVLAMVILARMASVPLRQPGLLALLVLSGGYLVFLVLAVAVAPLPLEEYTDAGNYRTVIVIRLLVVVDVVLAVVASGRALGWWAGAGGVSAPAPAAPPDVTVQ